jgi:hypothetical protein
LRVIGRRIKWSFREHLGEHGRSLQIDRQHDGAQIRALAHAVIDGSVESHVQKAIAQSQRFVLELEQVREVTADRSIDLAVDARSSSELAARLEWGDANLEQSPRLERRVGQKPHRARQVNGYDRLIVAPRNLDILDESALCHRVLGA